MKKEYKVGFSALLLMACGQVWAMSLDDVSTPQTEYGSYLQDLEIIEQTGKAPENPDLEADLAKMDSNERIRLTASRFSSTPLVFAQVHYSTPFNVAEILKKVEVIRVPEEFREMYADIYRQQLEQREGALTKEEQELLNLLRGGGGLDIVEHENPFKDVSMQKNDSAASSNNSGDPMVNAYFSSNRAFVSGSPAASGYMAGYGLASNGRSSSFVSPAMSNRKTTSTFRVSKGKNGTSARRSTSSLPSLRRNMFVD